MIISSAFNHVVDSRQQRAVFLKHRKLLKAEIAHDLDRFERILACTADTVTNQVGIYVEQLDEEGEAAPFKLEGRDRERIARIVIDNDVTFAVIDDPTKRITGDTRNGVALSLAAERVEFDELKGIQSESEDADEDQENRSYDVCALSAGE